MADMREAAIATALADDAKCLDAILSEQERVQPTQTPALRMPARYRESVPLAAPRSDEIGNLDQSTHWDCIRRNAFRSSQNAVSLLLETSCLLPPTFPFSSPAPAALIACPTITRSDWPAEKLRGERKTPG